MELGTRAVVRIGRLQVAGRQFSGLRAECGDYSWQGGRFQCRSGRFALPGAAEQLPFDLSFESGRLEVNFQPARDERWRLVRQSDGRLQVDIADGRLASLAPFLPLPPDWKLAGKVSGRLTLEGDSLEGKLRLAEAAFSEPSGLHAGEKIAVEAAIAARRAADRWDWQARVNWQGGEVFWQPVYAKAQGQTLEARGSGDSKTLRIESASLDLAGVGRVLAAAQWDRARNKLVSGRLESAGIDLDRGAVAILGPILTANGFPEVDMQGRLSFVLDWDGEGLAVASLGLDNVAVRAKNGRFAADGISGGLPWRREGRNQGYLSVEEARAGDFKLGAFRLPIEVEPRRFSVSRTEIPMLGSELVLERLVWRKSTKRQAWEGDLSLSLHPLSLFDLTRAFNLPVMTGTLSASFPHLRYREGAAFLDGALVVQVFEGYLNCTHLRLEDPFGPAPRLTADVEARNLNLGQLTETFSFGRIEGFADAEIKDLELVGWKPQRFDARVVSSPGNYRKRISQRAVQNISSLGGAGAGAAIQASFLRIFEEFGYDKIGLSCRLRGGVCEMGGVEESAKGYVMVKGGGIPALTVIGYNRQVDWPELVARLRDIIQKNVRPVIR